MELFVGILDIVEFLTKKSKNLQDRVKKFKKSQDSYQEFQEKATIGKEMQEASRFPFRMSVIIKPLEVSAIELINFQNIREHV